MGCLNWVRVSLRLVYMKESHDRDEDEGRVGCQGLHFTVAAREMYGKPPHSVYLYNDLSWERV